MTVKIKSKHEIKKMRKASAIVADVLSMLKETIKPGINTYELDKKALNLIKNAGGTPAFLGYKPHVDMKPFPGTLCISINEEVVHGIPSKSRILRVGDIVSVDVGVLKGNFYGDAAYTYAVGEITEDKEKLLLKARESLYCGIKEFKDKNKLGDIGAAIQNHAEKNGYSVVKTFVGHGIGKKLHEAPQVPNYGRPGEGLQLKTGMALAIEPMVNIGTGEVEVLDDGWTVVTADRNPSAHFEHTCVLTENGVEVLTEF
ncbi:MAG: type I methionyl aminopeptidase [Candidatus Muiribacteriota bacterium]